MEGNGTYYYSNGDRYEGEISQNLSNGNGTLFFLTVIFLMVNLNMENEMDMEKWYA